MLRLHRKLVAFGLKSLSTASPGDCAFPLPLSEDINLRFQVERPPL